LKPPLINDNTNNSISRCRGSSRKKIRVLIADDSALMRKLLREVLSRDPDIEVIGVARDGLEAIKEVLERSPDVLVLDIEMPRMNGLEVLRRLLRLKPTPTIVFSAFAKGESQLAIRALSLGALDVVSKPGGPISLDISEVAEELIRKIKVAAITGVRGINKIKNTTSITPVIQKAKKVVQKVSEVPRIAVAIASSTGGPSALVNVISKLPSDLPAAIFIVQHMPPYFTKRLAEHLDSISNIHVKEAVDGEIVRTGVAYVAPGDYHMIVRNSLTGDIRIKLYKGPKINNVRPSADPLFESVAKVFGKNSIAVVLTGLGRDGAEGVKAIKGAGGYVIAQDEETSVVFGMPKAAIETGCVDVVLPIHKIGQEIEHVIRLKYLSLKARLRRGEVP